MANQQRPPTNVAPQPQGPRQRILRIGILLGGANGGTPTLVEERLIRDRAPVSIGQSMKNTFSVPVEGMPLEFTLFAIDEGKYYLRFLKKMDGRLSDGGQVNTLDALKDRGAKNQGDYWQIALSDSSRGKLSFGDLTVLFQFVTEPPRQPKPMLPASVRGTLADRIDPRLSVILGASIILHFAVVIVALAYDVEIDTGMAARAYNLTFKQEQMVVDLETPKTQDQGADAGEKKPEEKKPDKQPEQSSQNTKKAPEDPGKAEREKALQEERAVDLANQLTGGNANGTAEGDMANRRPGGDLATQAEAVRNSGNQVAIGGGQNRGSRTGREGTGTGHGPNINGPGGTESAGGGKKETGPTGRISVSEKQFDEGLLDPDAVLKRIQQIYMIAIKRCYTSYLKKDASARGKVTLALTINPTGRVTQHSAKGFADEVDGCINNLMGSWRFAIPKDKSGDPTEANFQISLQLVPD
jgi:hypothetical protein